MNAPENLITVPPTILLKTVDFTPMVHPEKFAELTGLSLGVVKGWIRQEYIPTVKQGRYRMVNMIALTAQCSEGL